MAGIHIFFKVLVYARTSARSDCRQSVRLLAVIVRRRAVCGSTCLHSRTSFARRNKKRHHTLLYANSQDAQAAGVPLAQSYIAALTLLLQNEAWLARLRPLAAVGRMALSNYLLQSLIATTLFYGYGFGLFGQVGPALGLLITIAIFTAQIPLSVWWMGRFRFGPVEWLWRTLTYLRFQAIQTSARLGTLRGRVSVSVRPEPACPEPAEGSKGARILTLLTEVASFIRGEVA